MKKTNIGIIFVLLILVLTFMACNSSRKSACGCPSKKGMVGY